MDYSLVKQLIEAREAVEKVIPLLRSAGEEFASDELRHTEMTLRHAIDRLAKVEGKDCL